MGGGLLVRDLFHDVVFVRRWDVAPHQWHDVMGADEAMALVRRLSEHERWLVEMLAARVDGASAPRLRSFSGALSNRAATLLWSGKLVALRCARRDPIAGGGGGGGSPVEPKPELPKSVPPPVPADEERDWFEVRYVDELEEPIAGLQVEVTIEGVLQTLTTDGDGVISLDDVEAHSVSARIPEPPAGATPLRDILGPRWDQIREGPWLEEGGGILVRLLGRHHHAIFLTAKARRTVSIQPRVVRARLLGMFFDTNKCFLLPSAIPTIERLIQLYHDNHPSKLLVVGHTDTSGDPSYNDPLSLERAQSMAAYLQEDVDAWLEWYSFTKPWEKRWGHHEDYQMIAAMPDYPRPPEPPPASPVRWYQQTRGLYVDGDAGPDTRRALIGEYMGFDWTTLPSDVQLLTHGCGENFPVAEPGGPSDQRDRRAELYFFDDVLGVQPPPPGENSAPGSREYPEWERRAQETYEYHENYVDRRDCHVSVLLRSNSGRLVLANQPYRLHLDQGMVIEGDTDDDGLIEVQAVRAGHYLLEIANTMVRVPALKPEFARRIQRVPGARPITEF